MTVQAGRACEKAFISPAPPSPLQTLNPCLWPQDEYAPIKFTLACADGTKIDKPSAPLGRHPQQLLLLLLLGLSGPDCLVLEQLRGPLETCPCSTTMRHKRSTRA